MWCCNATTAYPPTTWPWSSTTPRRASLTSCAATICSAAHRANGCYNSCWVYPEPAYAHVPLVLAPDGTRLAKRHGAVTLADLAARGIGPQQVLARLGWSLGLCARDDTVTAIELADGFRLDSVPRTPWSLTATEL